MNYCNVHEGKKMRVYEDYPDIANEQSKGSPNRIFLDVSAFRSSGIIIQGRFC